MDFTSGGIGVRIWVSGFFVLLPAVFAVAEDKFPEGPATDAPDAIIDWYLMRDAEFYDLKKAGSSLQKKFKAEVQRDLGKLKDALEIQSYLKRQTVILNWITQYLLYQRYTQRGKYSPEEEAQVRKMQTALGEIPNKTQMLQAGYEVSDDTESWVAMKIKVVSWHLHKKYAAEAKAPTKQDEADVKQEFLKEKDTAKK